MDGQKIVERLEAQSTLWMGRIRLPGEPKASTTINSSGMVNSLKQILSSPYFTHLKSGGTTEDKSLLLTAVLADAINPGLTKMAESCPGSTYAKLSWLQSWHIRDETYSSALAELVNAQYRQPFAWFWCRQPGELAIMGYGASQN